MNHSKMNRPTRALQAIAAIMASAACCVAGAQTDTNATDSSTGRSSTGTPMTGTYAKPASSPASSPKGPSKAMPADPSSPHDPYDNAAPTSAGQTKTHTRHSKKHQAKQPQNAASANSQDTTAPDNNSSQDTQPGGMTR